jgi:outer membrane protein, heavy metal efflux system
MKQTISRTLVPLIVVLAALVLVSPCGFAEDPPVQVLSLRDAITSAINKWPELQAAAQVEASTAQLRRQAGFIPNPGFFISRKICGLAWTLPRASIHMPT